MTRVLSYSHLKKKVFFYLFWFSSINPLEEADESMEETEYDMFNRQVDELMESPRFSSGTFSLFCLLFIYYI